VILGLSNIELPSFNMLIQYLTVFIDLGTNRENLWSQRYKARTPPRRFTWGKHGVEVGAEDPLGAHQKTPAPLV
jgi:hypothetical protein